MISRSAIPSLPSILLGALLACSGTGCGGDALREARSLQERGAWGQSVAPLRSVLERAPDHPEANYRLGLALLRAGRAPQAVIPLRRAAESQAFGRPAGLLLTSLFLTTGSYPEATTAASRVLELDPENQAALIARASAEFEGRRPTHALADAERVVSLNPRSLDALGVRAASLAALQRWDEADAAFEQAYAAAVEQASPVAARNCLQRAQYLALRSGPARASQEIGTCLERHGDDPSAIALAVLVYDQLGQPESATTLLRDALGRRPADAGVRSALAARLAAGGRRDEAEASLLEGAQAAGDAELWRQLAALRAQGGDAAGARAALEQAVRLGGDAREDLRFALGLLLADQRAPAEAEALAEGFREPLYRDVLLAQVALDRGDAAAALERVEPVTERWPDFEPARMLAARAASELGEVEKAESHLREAVRAAPRASEAALVLARLRLASGDAESARGFALRHLRHRGFTGPEAHLIAARAAAALDRMPEARETLARLRGFPGQAAVAVAELAQLERAAAGPEAGIRAIEAAGLDLGDAANQLALHALLDLELALGHRDAAVARIAELSRRRPESAALLALHGQVLGLAGRDDEAAALFDRALALSPDEPGALAGRAERARRGGDLLGAAALFDRAAQRDPGDPAHALAAAQCWLAAGRPDEAESRLRALVHSNPELPAPANDLAWILAGRGESLDLALALARRAVAQARGPEVLDTLGLVLHRRGDHAQAVETLREALALAPGYATARYHLGLALAAQGQSDLAREALREALGGADFPEAGAARAELSRLEGARAR
jgi:tetratricopeptide (TPR) repeat protein